MKYTAVALIALVSADAVAGLSVSRSSLRQLSQPKNVAASSQRQEVGSALKMEGGLARCVRRGCFLFFFLSRINIRC